MNYYELKWDKDAKEREIFIKNLAPIVLFTYKRLEHTKKTVEALQKNIYAADSDLYIYSDAPKDSVAENDVKAVREYIHSVTGFKNITIIEREKNYGLAENIIDGVTRAVNKYGKVIVVEDDIVTSPYFLKFMNDALTVYQYNEKVMAVSGFCETDDRKAANGEVFFLPWFDCWGWATWKRSWQHFERNPQKLYEYCTTHDMTLFNRYNSYPDAFGQVKKNYTGEIYTWAIFFYATILFHKGLVAYSFFDHAHNIGNDGTGENCGDVDIYTRALADKAENKFPRTPMINEKMEKNIEQFFRNNITMPSLYMRVTRLYKRQGLRGIAKKVVEKIMNY